MTHGGNIYEIERRKGIARADLIDYSANINPLGVPEELKELIINQITALVNYPDPEYTELKQAIESFYRLDKEDIILGNGAAEVIHSFIRVIKPRKALLIQPSFSEYRNALEYVGAEIKEYYLKEEKDFQLDIKDLLENIADDIQLLIICNPNNPTSTLITRANMKKLVEFCCSKNVYIMIDEAFMDFVDKDGAITLIEEYRRYNRLFVVRAFTKFFGIPGLRLGFGVCCNNRLIEDMKKASLPWNINTFASGFGIMLRDNNRYVADTYTWLEAEREWFAGELNKLRGVKIYEPSANFILIKLLGEKTNTEVLRERLLNYKIMIRECKNFHGLDDSFFRIAIKDRATNLYFLDALNKCLE